MKLIDLLVQELPKRGGWPEGARETIEMHMDGCIFFDGDCAPDEFTLPQCSNGWAPGMWRFSNEVTREQYESALAASDGWIEWGGGGCPVETGVLVDIRIRNGKESHGVRANENTAGVSPDASYPFWRKDGTGGDIIAYRLHKPDINSIANDDRLEQDLNECIGQGVDMLEWNGEGLPPVGTICEALMPSLDNTLWRWRTVKVVESGAPGAEKEILAYDIENTKPAWTDQFRPLRTEAEKLREKAIVELVSVICGDVQDTWMATAEMYAKRVYDAGYRKEFK